MISKYVNITTLFIQELHYNLTVLDEKLKLILRDTTQGKGFSSLTKMSN